MYITGFFLLLSDLLIQFTSLHCPCICLNAPIKTEWTIFLYVIDPSALLFTTSRINYYCIDRLILHFGLVRRLSVQIRAAGFVLWNPKHARMLLCFFFLTIIGSPTGSNYQPLAAIANTAFANALFVWHRRDWQPVLWALMRSLCFTCCTTDVLQEVDLIIF